MNALSFTWSYIQWHYTDALVDMYFIMRNYAIAVVRFFSVKQLFRTLFAPWHRIGSHTTTLFNDPIEYFGDVLINLMMRILGFVERIVLLLAALLTLAMLFIISTCAFFGWFVLPVLFLSLFVNGCNQLFI